MSCIPFCYSCGRPIDCHDHGLCVICTEKTIEENKIIQAAKERVDAENIKD
jgi:NMD protein affecting ribosome stability and mRNA decay